MFKGVDHQKELGRKEVREKELAPKQRELDEANATIAARNQELAVAGNNLTATANQLDSANASLQRISTAMLNVEARHTALLHEFRSGALNASETPVEEQVNFLGELIADVQTKYISTKAAYDAANSEMENISQKYGERLSKKVPDTAGASEELSIKIQQLSLLVLEADSELKATVEKLEEAIAKEMALSRLIDELYDKHLDAHSAEQGQTSNEKVQALSDRLAELELEITAEKEKSRIFKEQAEELSARQNADAQNAKQAAEDLAKQIEGVLIKLSAAEKDGKSSKNKLLLLRKELEALTHLRAQAFIDRAIKVYVRHMKKVDTYGGDIELQAIADMFAKNIDLSHNPEDLSQYTRIKSSLGSTIDVSDASLKILGHTSSDAGHNNIVYQPISDAGVIIPISTDSSCLFTTSFIAMQISEGKVVPIQSSNLTTAAYSFRLQVCEFLLRNDKPIRNIFEQMINEIQDIFAPQDSIAEKDFEQFVLEKTGGEEPASAYMHQLKQEWRELKKSNKRESASQRKSALQANSVYSIILAKLQSLCTDQIFIDNICKIFGQHYPKISDSKIQERSDAHSISSYSSLEDEDDFEFIDNPNISLSFRSHDERLRDFFKGNSREPNNSNEDDPSHSLADRYIHYLAHNNPFPGPVEFQALASIYDWQIHVKAFEGASRFNAPQYFKVFEPGNAKEVKGVVELQIINAGTATPRFSFNVDDEEASFYDAAVFFAGLGKKAELFSGRPMPVEDIKRDIREYLLLKMKGGNYRSFPRKCPNDGISQYFYNYIFGVGRAHEFIEFNLLPVNAPFVQEAKELRASRKLIFKVANEVLEQMGEQVSSTMQAWVIPQSETSSYLELADRMRQTRPYVAQSSAFMLQLISLGATIAGIVTGQGFSAEDAKFYEGAQGTAWASSFISSIIYVSNYWIEEGKRTRAVEIAQRELILNIPLDSISEVALKHVDGAANDKIFSAPFKFDNEFLLKEWAQGMYEIAFKFKGGKEGFSITKERHLNSRSETPLVSRVPGNYRRDYSAPTFLALCVTVNFALTVATIADVEQQIQAASNSTANNSSNTPPPYTAPIESIVNYAPPLFAMAAMIVHSVRGPRRQCENDLANLLKEVSRVCANNQRPLPTQISVLLQHFGVNAELASSLTKIRQMPNIQRGLFRARQELNVHSSALKEIIVGGELQPDSDEAKLLLLIVKITDVLNTEELIIDEKKLEEALLEVRETTRKDSASSHVEGAKYSLRKFSGILRFSAQVTKPKKGVEATEAVEEQDTAHSSARNSAGLGVLELKQ